MITHSPEETIEFGKQLGKTLKENTIICLEGDLGAGKTTLVKGIVEGYCGSSRDIVVSPTYVLLNLYSGSLKKNLYHFDLYRLSGADEFLSLGFEEFFTRGGVSCIEWSEKVKELLPASVITITLYSLDESARKIAIENLL
jgi:tRNA threonylcarbamoyladenosine biosynthesis protein TsaE